MAIIVYCDDCPQPWFAIYEDGTYESGRSSILGFRPNSNYYPANKLAMEYGSDQCSQNHSIAIQQIPQKEMQSQRTQRKAMGWKELNPKIGRKGSFVSESR